MVGSLRVFLGLIFSKFSMVLYVSQRQCVPLSDVDVSCNVYLDGIIVCNIIIVEVIIFLFIEISRWCLIF